MAASVFEIIENSYDSRNETQFKSINIRNFRYGIVTSPFAAPSIWSSVPKDHKKCNSVATEDKLIKKQKTNLKQKLSFAILKTACPNFAIDIYTK